MLLLVILFDAVLTLNFDKNGQKNYIGGATFLEVYDAWNEKLETSMDNMEHYSSVLESYKNIVDIVPNIKRGLEKCL